MSSASPFSPADSKAPVLVVLFAVTWVSITAVAQTGSTRLAGNGQGKPAFPRLMGMNIGAKNYDDPDYQKQLARLDVVILGFYKGWKPGYGMAKVVRNLKELSGGRILVGQYTILNECGDDPKNTANLDVQTKLNTMNWWARKRDGSRVQWTTEYRSWDINFTAWSKPDADGQRFPQWLAQWDDNVFFKPVPFDLWYCDNVMWQPRVTADWNGDGTDDDPKDPAVAAAYRAGHRAEWDHIRKIHPGLPLMGNTDSDLGEPEFTGQLEGGFLEALMGKKWSLETWAGWPKMMQRYRGVMANSRAPHLVGFNVHGKTNDFRFFRYAFSSCLLDDGFFCFTDDARGYSSVSWFDEFDFKLGAATITPPTAAWTNGVWRRDFEHGTALVNPTSQRATVEMEPGFQRLSGRQDAAVNDGRPVSLITLEPKDGIILRRAAASTLWVQAKEARACSPLMVPASQVGLSEESTLGECLVPMVTATAEAPAPDCWAEFRVLIPESGSYRIWGRVRFPAGTEEAFRLDWTNAAGSPGELVFGGGPDARQWHWVNAGVVQLPAGPWTFWVGPHRAAASTFGPLRWRQAELTQTPRLNLLCLTEEHDFVPSDAEAQTILDLTKTKPSTAQVAASRLASLANDWSPPDNRKRVPDWMRCPRWFTKDSWRDELRYRQAGDIAALVREVAANNGQTLRLSCFWGGETFYQSRVAPHTPGLGELDYLREALDEGARTGVKVVVYINPNALCLEHPLTGECVVREADGEPSKRPAYGASWRPAAVYACINHPRYRRFLQEVLTEMFTRYQPAGLYVDGLTPHVCFCEHCRARWRELFASEMPAAKLSRVPASWAVWSEFGRDPQPVGDVENDDDARRLTEFLRRTLVEMTHEVSQTVKRAKPDAVTLFHSHPKPGSDDDYDGTLTEVYSPRPWVHNAWRSEELAGYSAVYRVPVLFNVYPHRHFTAAEARYHALQGLAAGAYPNFWSAAGMKPVFDYMNRCAEYLDFDTTTPVKFLALPRDLYESDTQRRAQVAPGVSYARDRFLAPYVGAYSALMRSGLPVVTLHRPHFEEALSGFRVLVLANVALMTDAQAEAVRRFVRDGGGLIATHETSLLDAKGQRRADFALADVFGVHYQNVLPAQSRTVSLLPGHPLASGLPANPPLIHDEPLVVVTPTEAEAAGELGERQAQVLTHRYGKGRVVYLPGRFDSIQCYSLMPAVERLFANAVRWVVPEGLPVEVEADGTVGVSLFRQAQRLVVHIVNHQRDSEYRSDAVTPLQKISLRLALPEGAREPKARRLWENRNLEVQVSRQTLQIQVGAIDEYEAVAVDWQVSQ